MSFVTSTSYRLAKPHASPRPAWRTDIEGLRGVAVLLVVLYHAELPGFSGGYIGHAFNLHEWKDGSERVFQKLSPAAQAIIVLRDSQLARADIPLCLSRRSWQQKLGVPAAIGGPSCDFAASTPMHTEVHQAQIEAARAYDNVRVIDLTDVICPGGTCTVETNDYILYRDSHHLTASYVASLSDLIDRLIRETITATRDMEKARAGMIQ